MRYSKQEERTRIRRPARGSTDIYIFIYSYIYIYIYIYSAASRGSATAFFGLSLSVRLQSACWCRRARRENDFEMLQNNTKYLAKKPSKSFDNRPTIMNDYKKTYQIYEKTSLERCRRRSAHLGGRPVGVRPKPETFGVQFRSGNRGKCRKTPSEKT